MNSRFHSKIRSWLVAAPCLCLLAACAVPTPYQAADGGYGYKEQQLEENRYRVSFDGNASTEREDVQNFLLYRAAELTIERGQDYFTIVERNLDRSTRYHSHSYANDFGYAGYRSRRSFRRHIGPRYVSGSSYPINEYSSTADIVLGEGEKPADDANAYDALDVLQRLQSFIRPPAAE